MNNLGFVVGKFMEEEREEEIRGSGAKEKV
jgi:hypothetical protein